MQQPGNPTATDCYAVVKEHLDRITACYDELLAACDEHLETLKRLVAEEEDKPQPNRALVERLQGQMGTGREFLDILETITHDGLIRATDRAILIKIAAEGRFV